MSKCPNCKNLTNEVSIGSSHYEVCSRFPVCSHKTRKAIQAQSGDEIYVVFDTETTGLKATENEIIEIAAVKVQHGKVIDTFEALIKPKRYVPANITAITGITNEMLEGQPSEQEVIPKYIQWLKSADIIAAHNLGFDARFLKSSCARTGARFPVDMGAIDTVQVARSINNCGAKSSKLNDLCNHLNISLIGHHRAMNDVMATKDVLLVFQSKTTPVVKLLGDFVKSK